MSISESQSPLLDHGSNGNGEVTFYDALEGGQGNDEEPTEEEPDSSGGLADGFSTWSDSLQAFHQAIFHGILYMTIGIVFYSFILETKLTVVESAYFSVAIFTTVGYGDISPEATNAGMIFTMFFALYGIIILGIFLGILGDMAVERQERLQEEVMKTASSAYLDTMLADHSHVHTDESKEEDENSFISDIFHIVNEQRTNIAVLIVLAIPVMLIEKFSFVEGMYWLVITGTTIGLGDKHPEHEWSKFICIFYVPLAVAFGGSFLGQIATTYVDKRNDALEAQFLSRALTESALEKMDANNDNTVTKDEFLVYMLKTLDKVEQDDIDKILALFEKLDKDKSGSLTVEDIEFIPKHTAKLKNKNVQKAPQKKDLASRWKNVRRSNTKRSLMS